MGLSEEASLRKALIVVFIELDWGLQAASLRVEGLIASHVLLRKGRIKCIWHEERGLGQRHFFRP